MYDADAVVIGAGPAGSVTAGEIASAGHDVLLVERDAVPGKTNVCGGVTPQEVADAFEIPQSVVERTIPRWNCYFPKETFSFDIPFVSFRRCVFDRFLAERAVAKGARMETETVVSDVAIDDDGVTVRLGGGRARGDREIRTKVVVFADGPDSMAGRKFGGVGFRRRPERTFHGLLYELDWKENPYDSLDLYFDERIAAWGYGWVFPKRDVINAGICGLISVMKESGGPTMRQRLDYFVKDHPGPSRALAGRPVLGIQAAIIPVEQAARLYGRRLLVVGDAAGMVEPFSAGGNEYAMRGGLLAGRTVAGALKLGRFDEATLSEYQTQWRRGNDFKTLNSIQRLLRLGLLYQKVRKGAGMGVYSYFFHKVADQARGV